MKSLTDNLNVNLLELLSVLLPGGLITIIFLQDFSFLQKLMKYPNEEIIWQDGLMSFGISYFLGYTLYVGSSFLDHWYDCLKNKAVGKKNAEGKNQQNKNEKVLKLTKKDLKCWARFILPYVHNTHNLINKILVRKIYYLGIDYETVHPIDAFQWSYRYLMNKDERMFSEVERYYSTARFFRSMTLVFFISSLFNICKNCQNVFFFAVLCMVSFYLFLDRWQKTNHVAFKNVLILEAINNPANEDKKIV